MLEPLVSLLLATVTFLQSPGNQQYTARGLKFNGCTTAVQMIWDWGFNWQQVSMVNHPIG